MSKPGLRKRIWWWINEDAPMWMRDCGIADAVLHVLCWVLGHAPVRDQCNLPEHDYCVWCFKNMPGRAHDQHILDRLHHTDPVEPLLEMLTTWRREMSVAIGERMRLCFQRGEVAQQCDRGEYDRLCREFAVLGAWQDSLWDTDGLMELWAEREAVERVVL